MKNKGAGSSSANKLLKQTKTNWKKHSWIIYVYAILSDRRSDRMSLIQNVYQLIWYEAWKL